MEHTLQAGRTTLEPPTTYQPPFAPKKFILIVTLMMCLDAAHGFLSLLSHLIAHCSLNCSVHKSYCGSCTLAPWYHTFRATGAFSSRFASTDTLFNYALLYYVLQILCFLQIKSLWQPGLG